MDAETRKQVERATYDRKLGRERPAYASFWNRGLYDAMMSAELEPELERLAGEHLAGRRVLVLGAGADEIRLVQRFTDRIWALNISERAVAELSREFPSVRAFVADAEQLDAIGERFDVVYCKSILHHLHPLDRVLASIARRLAPGGVLFVAMEPGLYNPFAALGRRFTPSQSHTPGERALVFSDFSRLARRELEVVYERHHFLWSMLLPLLARRAPRLEPVLRTPLALSLSAERALRRIPGAKDLFWVMTGVYRLRG